jgi:hypothetical protein
VSCSFYIYYKVAAQNADKVRAAALELQRAVLHATGIPGRLMCRRDQPDTWMEIYEGVADAAAFQAALDSELQRLQFGDLIGPDARRVTELFRPL